MRVMSGIFCPDSGSVTVDGRNVWDSAEAKADICYVGDELSWYERFTIGELKAYCRNSRTSFSEEAFDRMVRALELPKDRKLQLVGSEGGVTREMLEQAGLAVLNYTSMGSVAQVIVRGTEEKVQDSVSKLSVNLAETVPLTLEEAFIYEMREKGYGKINAEE